MSEPLVRVLRMLVVLLGSAAAGAALCVMKGDGGGLLDALGNLSAPYAITAVVAGRSTLRFWSGALLGIAATEAMLGGFYSAYGVLLGHEVSPATLSYWGVLGLASGTVCGVAGQGAARRAALRYCIPALLLLEPLALRIEVITSRFGLGSGDITGDELVAFAIEITIGAVALLVVRARVVSERRAVCPRRVP